MTHALTIVGIDPGLTGALAFYAPSHPHLVTVEDLPVAGSELDAVTLAARIAQLRPDLAVVELVHANPVWGVSGCFKFGKAAGVIHGVLGALHVPVHVVASGKWKRHFRLDGKDDSRARAIAYWPERAEQFSKKKDHNRAEAALIARWGAECLPVARQTTQTEA